jgi:glutathione-regulated potassium-efflux system ancillary protein KefG
LEHRVLVLFAHPNVRNSKVGRALRDAALNVLNVTMHDIYAAYPDFVIDVEREKALLMSHQLIVFQHPMYWYSSPALLKQWQDDVLEYGWAYGPGGTALRGKTLLSALSAGGTDEAYHSTGHNRYEIAQLLTPFDQTAHLCGMHYAKPFVVHDARRLDATQIGQCAQSYAGLLSEFVKKGSLP